MKHGRSQGCGGNGLNHPARETGYLLHSIVSLAGAGGFMSLCHVWWWLLVPFVFVIVDC